MNPRPSFLDRPSARSRAIDATSTQSLIRSAAALLLCHVEGKQLKEVVRDHWPHDRNIETITKAASSPMTEANTPGLTALGVANLIDLLGPALPRHDVR